jgi:hypothetical protein
MLSVPIVTIYKVIKHLHFLMRTISTKCVKKDLLSVTEQFLQGDLLYLTKFLKRFHVNIF